MTTRVVVLVFALVASVHPCTADAASSQKLDVSFGGRR